MAQGETRLHYKCVDVLVFKLYMDDFDRSKKLKLSNRNHLVQASYFAGDKAVVWEISDFLTGIQKASCRVQMRSQLLMPSQLPSIITHSEQGFRASHVDRKLLGRTGDVS